MSCLRFTLGLDFGTNSARALIVRCRDGKEMGVGVAPYRSGAQGIILDPDDHHLARQSPADHLEALQSAVRLALRNAGNRGGFSAGAIVGLAIDTTGSSPLPVDAQNRALALAPKWAHNPNAQCWLWKDHTSWREAERITAMAAKHRPNYLTACGGAYSSEWFWSKIWHCLKVAPDVFESAHSWVELCDWLPAVLAGVNDPRQIRRGVCAAGHKAMYSDSWGGLPDKAFLRLLHPKLAALRDRLYEHAHDSSSPAGALCVTWARKLGLPAGIPIGIGLLDVHAGAIGCGVRTGTVVKVIGTSTCDCAVTPATEKPKTIPGISGVVKGAILPGYWGIEAGQSAVGDIFRWWAETICAGDSGIHETLTREAAKLEPAASGVLALDWHNGSRNILADPRLTGVLVGCTLHTTRAEVYRALIESTAFGARMILERLREHSVRIERVVCAGGIAEKNPLLMQLYADITHCTMEVAASKQACALGSAIIGAVVAGAYSDFASAQNAMVGQTKRRYTPQNSARKTYDRLFALYAQLHRHLGEPAANEAAAPSTVLKGLLALKDESTSKPARRNGPSRSR